MLRRTDASANGWLVGKWFPGFNAHWSLAHRTVSVVSSFHARYARSLLIALYNHRITRIDEPHAYLWTTDIYYSR
jgi:hypothetical protein